MFKKQQYTHNIHKVITKQIDGILFELETPRRNYSNVFESKTKAKDYIKDQIKYCGEELKRLNEAVSQVRETIPMLENALKELENYKE